MELSPILLSALKSPFSLLCLLFLCFLGLLILNYSPFSNTPSYPLSRFLNSWKIPLREQSPPHPTMPGYSGTQKRLINQFVDCTQARDSVAAKVCLLSLYLALAMSCGRVCLFL